ncbi:MAG: orotate phosphoribosyltransferase-like protein [Polaribacter sp.]|jgi:orotate phosphoribosyltransferase-like protein
MKPKTRQEIAQELIVSRTTLYRLLKREGIKLPKELLYAREQKMIYEKLGISHSHLEILPELIGQTQAQLRLQLRR